MSPDAPPPSARPDQWTLTQPPNPGFKFGQKVDATPEGREWLKGLDSGFTSIDTAATPDGLANFMTAGIIPRPIAFVSSVSKDGLGNLGLFSWFNQVSGDPPVISVSCTNHDNRVKDTVRNIRDTRGFVVNIISDPFIQNANACSIDTPPEVSEWPLSGLTQEPSVCVKAPRVRESAFAMECELLKDIDIVDPITLKATTTLVLGHVKYIHMRNDILHKDRKVPDPGKLKPVLRLGGPFYARLGEGYELRRPSWADVQKEVRDLMKVDAQQDADKKKQEMDEKKQEMDEKKQET